MLLEVCRWIITHIFRLDPASHAGMILEFFLYDSVKIIGLLLVLMFFVGLLRSFIPVDRIKKWMNLPFGLGHVAASFFGAVTPFCSCSSIPIFYTLLKSGVPLGVAFSFLITSPMVNEYVLFLMFGFFGWKISVLYALSGMLMGIFCGMAIGRMHLEKYLEEDLALMQSGAVSPMVFHSWKDRIKYGWHEAATMLAKIWMWILAGVALGAVIHNFVPKSFFDAVVSSTGVLAVPLAVAVGVPMYGNCAAIVPVAIALFQKGVPLGTALAFMMATSALSLPEAVILRRAMRLPLIILFFAITAVGIMITGYLFNAIPFFFPGILSL